MIARARKTSQQDAGQRHRERMAQRSRDQSRAAAEIGDYPPVQNQERKDACRLDLLAFLVSYFPHSTGLKPFSNGHKRVIRRLQQCILDGGRIGNKVFRGFAKTTIAENAGIWAVLYGHRKYFAIFGANREAADDIIHSIKTELEENDLLYDDFPEACHAIRALEGKPQRCGSQTYQGVRTRIEWKADRIVLPTIYDENGNPLPHSGAILRTKGLNAGSRGMKHKMPDGTQQRPDFILIDDPQDDECAGSRVQIAKLLKIIVKNLLNLAGHNRRLAIAVNATAIEKDDAVQQLSNPAKFPSWQWETIKMVDKFADAHETFWLGEYKKVRESFDRNDPEDQKRAHCEATELYASRQDEADAGCVVAWEHCYNEEDGEISAIQHAYNMLIDNGEEAFASECQQEPLDPEENKSLLTSDGVASKINRLARGKVPKSSMHLTAYVDVHKRLLYWLVAAWEEGFGGDTIDYNTYPEQSPGLYFAQATAPIAMSDRHPKMDEDAWILASLGVTVDGILARQFVREDGAPMRVGKLLVDAKWGEKTELVKSFCRRHQQAGSVVLPAMGVGLGPLKKSFNEYRPEPGAQQGYHCRIPPPVKGDRICMIDTNRIKSFAAARLALPVGTPGGWEFFGDDPKKHKLIGDHCVAERPKQLKATETNVTVDQWELLPNCDNHLWDCLCGAAAAASLLGIRPAGVEAGSKRRSVSERPSLSELAGRR